ncbi:hypothetical protein H0H92_008389 [Tricholoma furcatifolium]|nr:hypothetical protein H0H92_008389 [Tricholoma furcatifolium]
MTGDGQVYGTPEREVTRQRVNWIRTSGTFDAVFDFDKLLADPANPAQLLPQYDSGDHLHPNVAAYEVMVASIPLELFSRNWEVETGGFAPPASSDNAWLFIISASLSIIHTLLVDLQDPNPELNLPDLQRLGLYGVGMPKFIPLIRNWHQLTHLGWKEEAGADDVQNRCIKDRSSG